MCPYYLLCVDITHKSSKENVLKHFLEDFSAIAIISNNSFFFTLLIYYIIFFIKNQIKIFYLK